MTDTASGNSTTHQSLYRRFRPQSFGEVIGQDHVTLALRNAVRQDQVGHAYLFSGPRGTGKTSTARILAKALNCAAADDGEPCGKCDSCTEIARGTSLDVHELDAASNNGVDAMRDLVSRAALGTPGRWKVYIVDEVHMLSTAASNALLKTLEEPPGHVVFVLATTDAQKVLPTIRSRTQHYEFRLLGPDTLSGLVRQVRDSAGLELGDDAVAAAVRKGRGSARDALSALDQVAASGVVEDEIAVLIELGEALAEHDATRAIVTVAQATAAGRDVHNLTNALVEHLRQGFLVTVAPELVSVVGEDLSAVQSMAMRMGLPGVVRAMEALGRSLVDMRDAPDPRVNLETTLIRLSHPEADDSTGAVLERLERLERSQRESPPAAPATAGHEPQVAQPSEAPGVGAAKKSVPGTGPDLARKTLGAIRRKAAETEARSETEPAANAPTMTPLPAPSPDEPAPPAPPGVLPSRDALVEAWGDSLLTKLPARARARFRMGRFVAVQEGTAVFALPNETHRSYCEEVRVDVERSLAEHFGIAVPMKLVVDQTTAGETSQDGRTPAAVPDEAGSGALEAASEEHEALLGSGVLEAETQSAGAALSAEQRLKSVFPGAEEV